MDGHRKRKRQVAPGIADTALESEFRGNQTLPVADLPPDFDGVPLDGAQYLAIVRQESETVPAICYVANPFARVESTPSGSNQSWRRESVGSELMPSLEWRKSFLVKFENMRNTLSMQTQRQSGSHQSQEEIPRGRNGKKWYRFLHGRSLLEEVEYDEEEYHEGDSEGETDFEMEYGEAALFSCREPSEALLHRFSTSQIISLLGVLPYWLTQPHVSPKTSKDQAIDPFHSRWLFALLAHLESQLVGDDVSVLRTLARACLACIIQSRMRKGTCDQEKNLQDEMGSWMIVCAIVGIWGQHDLWEEGFQMLHTSHQS